MADGLECGLADRLEAAVNGKVLARVTRPVGRVIMYIGR